MKNYMQAKEAAKYAKEDYSAFIGRLRSGQIRAIKRGRRWITTDEWIDNYYESLEEKSPFASN